MIAPLTADHLEVDIYRIVAHNLLELGGRDFVGRQMFTVCVRPNRTRFHRRRRSILRIADVYMSSIRYESNKDVGFPRRVITTFSPFSTARMSSESRCGLSEGNAHETFTYSGTKPRLILSASSTSRIAA